MASRPTSPPLPAHLASRPTTSPLPAHLASKPTTSPLPAHTVSQAPPAWQASWDAASSGAQAGDEAALQLGALDRSGLLALATLDNQPAPSSSGSFGPPDEPVPPGTAPAAPRPSARAARPVDVPLDLFAPPGGDADVVVELADDELAHRAHKRSKPPAAVEPEPRRSSPALATEPPARRSSPAIPPEPGTLRSSSMEPSTTPATTSPLTPKLSPLPQARPAPPAEPRTRLPTATPSPGSPRLRFAVGVLLAIALGFIPAHVVASLREEPIFRERDAQLLAVQAAVDSRQSYDALDGIRAAAAEAKQEARTRIALTSMLIWAGAAGVLAYAWFKLLPWNRPS